jgi:hypothetical protein
VQFGKEEERANSFAGVMLPPAVQVIATIYNRTSTETVFSLVAIDSLGSELHYSAGRIFGHLGTVSPRIAPVPVTWIHKYAGIYKKNSYLELCSLY